MSIDHPDHATTPGVGFPAGPACLDTREVDLAEGLHLHVLLRDACLAPAPLIAGKLDRLDHADGPTRTLNGTRTGDDRTARLSVVAQMTSIRRRVQDSGSLLPSERRRLVLLDVLAAMREESEPGVPWSRSPVDLLGEAATPIGHSATDVRRLARRLAVARTALPAVEAGPSTTRALAESLRGVLGTTPGVAALHAVLLLSDRMPHGWAPSGCGAVLLDPAPGVGFAGTLVARHDLPAFVEDLATLRVAADLSPTVHRYASVMLPELAAELRSRPAADRERRCLQTAADLVDRTTALLPRGFRRFDRIGRRERSRFVV